jgi:hypothetical protein
MAEVSSNGDSRCEMNHHTIQHHNTTTHNETSIDPAAIYHSMETIDSPSSALLDQQHHHDLGGMPPLKTHSWLSTEESSEMASSAYSDGIYEVIEYDLDAEHEGMEYLQEISIHKDSPAAAALRANAEVKVPAYSKAARAVHMQTVRRALKRARGGGNRKGKPPRAPPPNSLLGGHNNNNSTDPFQSLDEDLASLSLNQPHMNNNIPLHLRLNPLEESDEIPEEEEEEEGAENDLSIIEQDHQAVAVPEMSHSGDSSAARVKRDEVPTDDMTAETFPNMNTVGDTMHFPMDNITPGTVEAGKKGTW